MTAARPKGARRTAAAPREARLLATSLRDWRERAGLSQVELAARAGTSRQTLHAIESGRAAPGTPLALRLSQALGCRVEDVFRLRTGAAPVTVRLAGPPLARGASARVRVALAGSGPVAVPLVGPLATVASILPADGVATGGRGGRVDVRLLGPAASLRTTVVVAGCDPALPVIAAHLRRIAPRFDVAWLPAGSLAALRWLREGAVHVAGLHLRDAATGQENVPLVRRLGSRLPTAVLGFAVWEQGLIVPRGNPRGIRGIGDLARPGIAIVNREPGSGARALLDAALAREGIVPRRVRGYAREAPSHLAVAQAVALGFVDAGIGVRAAAGALECDFVPLQRERYDLVVPQGLLDHPPVQAFLDAARRPAARDDLAALGYDTSRLGDTLATVS